MAIRQIFLVLGILVAGSPAIADDGLYSMWCSEESGEIGLNRHSIDLMEHSCSVEPNIVQIGKPLKLHCSGDSGRFDALWQIALSGDTLTVTEDGSTTTYQRCK